VTASKCLCTRFLPFSRQEGTIAGKVAGIDVHKKVLMVVVIDADAPATKPERLRFTTMPSELSRLSTWLKSMVSKKR
jgi:hypothetical protein